MEPQDPINGSAGGEIDILEALGSPTAYMTFHCHSNNSFSHGSIPYTNASLAAGFHTYSVQWAPGRLVWYIDHINVTEVSNSCVPDIPMYVLGQHR
jgi:beta-glucanase (GH16 family)